MRLILTLALIAVLATPVFAEPVDPTGLPVPAPSIAEFTIIQGTGWSSGRSRNESLACDLAHQRAIHQIKTGIAVAKQQHLMTAEDLTVAVTKPVQRVWDAEQGRCTVYLELVVPVLPTAHPIRMAQERQY